MPIKPHFLNLLPQVGARPALSNVPTLNRGLFYTAGDKAPNSSLLAQKIQPFSHTAGILAFDYSLAYFYRLRQLENHIYRC